MLSRRDVLVLPAGVVHEPGMLVDEARGASYALNAAGELVVENEGRELGRTIDRISSRWSLEPDEVARDVLAFAWALNAASLANVRRPGPAPARFVRWLVLALGLVPLGIAPPVLKRRRRLETATLWTAVLSATLAAAGRGALVAVCGCLALLPLLAGTGSRGLVSWVVIGAAAGIGVVAHEVGHAVALRGVPAAVVASGLTLSILHPLGRGRRAAAVALLGPAVPAAAAVVATSLAVRTGSLAAAVAACPLGAHVLTATLAGRDGRAACRS